MSAPTTLELIVAYALAKTIGWTITELTLTPKPLTQGVCVTATLHPDGWEYIGTFYEDELASSHHITFKC